MHRLLKTIVFLVVATILLVSGVDTALGQLSASPTESTFALYDQSGQTLMSYNGDLNLCDRFTHLYRMAPRAVQAPPAIAPRA